MLAALFIASLAHADEVPLPDAPRRAPERPLPVARLPELEQGGRFWVPHRTARGFLYAEAAGAGAIVVGLGFLQLQTEDWEAITGAVLLVTGSATMLVCIPSVLVAESFAAPHSAAPKTGLALGWTGVGLMAMAPVFALTGVYEAPGPMLGVGSVLIAVGGPVQFFADDKKGPKLALLPTGSGLALAGRW